MPPESIAEKKARLRSHYRDLRSRIPQSDFSSWNESITRQVLEMPQVQAAHAVFIYRSFAFEVATGSLISAFAAAGKRLIVPTQNHRALPADGFTELKFQPGSSKYAENPVSASEALPSINFVVVPGIVWDRAGYRIGFGGGYFDRLLAMLGPGCLSIGLSFDCQVTEDIPHEAWDKPVQFLSTQTGIISTMKL
jgi:5-formyltetrahydrofolate cyclo-ligase